ncbi:hypothetical protein ACFV4K_29115 [Nocardia sp. NPDC059764]|uniref:hypothetical protein n=1 Tax=Nocardia sp. NPDC059764 TaxID=3346939 RepID=UPI00365C62C2
MLAGIARSAVVAAVAAPLVALAAAAPASASEPTEAAVNRPVAVQNVDAPYIWVNICVHIPTPGSATLNWCFP